MFSSIYVQTLMSLGGQQIFFWRKLQKSLILVHFLHFLPQKHIKRQKESRHPPMPYGPLYEAMS